VAGGHVAHVNVAWHLVASHDVDMLWQHGQIEQGLHSVSRAGFQTA